MSHWVYTALLDRCTSNRVRLFYLFVQCRVTSIATSLANNSNQLYFVDECDGMLHCTDGSDEFDSCDEDEFTCDCLITKTCNKCRGCINKTLAVEGGFIECPDEIRITYGRYGKIDIYKLNNILECDEIGFPRCDNSTCFSFNLLASNSNQQATTSYLICTSFCSDQQYCHKKPIFQCSDNSLIFLDHFCDGVVDCDDGSDEIVYKPGFRCNKCVLPQNNLYDDLAQCGDNSDLCLFANNDSCFQCLDKHLIISSKQVCDGVYDCYDLSDECLCDIYFHIGLCASRFVLNNSVCFDADWLATSHTSLKIYAVNSMTRTLACQTKYGSVNAKPCDGRPECRNFIDECQCNNPPSFCNDSCHSFFPMGDRYCDGVEDPAWMYLDKTLCPKGFDESVCPQRFKCNATGNVSIDVLQVCDGKPDCDDRSDENNCPHEKNKAIFSFYNEMITEPVLKYAIWIIGFIALFGNVCVIINVTIFLKKQAISFFEFQRFIILNISIADFIMGVYAITIAAYSQAFSGIYDSVDREWRSSLRCSIIGSLSVISSEASCFFMVVLIAFRLMKACKSTASLTSSLRSWKLCVGIAWLLSLLFSIVPVLLKASSYFVHSISFSSKFHQNGSIEVAQLKQFMCRYAILSNTTVKDYGSDLESIDMFFKDNLPDSLPVRKFGLYGGNSVCMPRLNVSLGEPGWEYIFTLITFNLLCFIFIAVGYVEIYRRSNKTSANACSNRSEQQAVRMQKRISLIIGSNFCCWIPICIMAYISFNAVTLSATVDQVITVLLQINSALNPLLFLLLPRLCKSY